MSTWRASSERRAAAAGTFYPADPHELAAQVDALLEAARPPEDVGVPLALVVPHAGYVFSGPVAATAYAYLRGRDISRVALLGPAHFVPLHGSAVPGADTWRTPLGPVRIDPDLRRIAVEAGAVVDDRPHEPEHSLEVQLPFLARALGREPMILPIAVGVAETAAVADLIAALPPHTLVVVSTDLSHYQDQATAERLDRRTAEAVLAREPGAIGTEDACGSYALRGLVELTRRDGLAIRLLDLRTSADTAGDPWRVVGYGAFVVDGRA
ncbi:MAG: AmmeMemoRadiSam system protein B [Actinomycetota bacterium]